jgi:nucleotide-binding universal stress UspA family protein
MSASEMNQTYGGAATVPVPLPAEIVVGLDDSHSAAAALRWATEQSGLTGSRLRVVYAWQLSAFEAAGAAGSAQLWEALTADARARATHWVLDALGGTAAEVRWTLDIVEGPPGPVLVDRSRAASLLVLGTREHIGLRRAVLGSVSHYCLSHAESPVVAIPAPQPAQFAFETRARVALATPGPLL